MKQDVIDLANAIATSNTSLSATDKEDLTALYNFGYLQLPQVVPNKENLAYLGALFFKSSEDFGSRFKTATDVLRLATALSDGDVSLAENTKFKSLSRASRRRILSLLEQCGNLEEDMLRWSERWKRLGERLKPGEVAKKFPRAYTAFSALRNDIAIPTFNSRAEALIRSGETAQAAALLMERPGDFARRLDKVVREATNEREAIRVINSFTSVADKVSTPVLLQVLTHFDNRSEGSLRVVFPKGNISHVQALKTTLPHMSVNLRNRIVEACRDILVKRFTNLPSLGKTYIDPRLADILLPFSQRSASKSLRSLVRGSRIPFGDDKNTIRFFVWWKNQSKKQKGDNVYNFYGRVDIDLSASFYDNDWNATDAITYYQLRGEDHGDIGCHSGDITDAPNGACEFIDINIPAAIKRGVRFVVMNVNSFTGQNFIDIPECSAGWMLRSKPQSGEVFDARTVQDKVDITMEAKVGIPMVIDLVERKTIWVDSVITYKSRGYGFNVANTLDTLTLVGKAFTEIRKPSLLELLTLHVRARGEQVDDPAEATTIFSLESGIQFELERIASEFMADKTIAAKASV
jgi:hypothetical protein